MKAYPTVAILVGPLLFCTGRLQPQVLTTILGANCNALLNTPPAGAGNYSIGILGFGGAACTITAVCPQPNKQFAVFARAATTAACPQDQVLNQAGDSYSQILLDVDAFSSALDLNNALIRFNSYASSACGGYSATDQNDYPQVCGTVTISNGGPPPETPVYYGYCNESTQCIF